jgi:hypothetical protein
MRPDPPTAFRIVSVTEARKLTGVPLPRLREKIGVSEFTQYWPDGRRVAALRIPVDLLDELTRAKEAVE